MSFHSGTEPETEGKSVDNAKELYQSVYVHPGAELKIRDWMRRGQAGQDEARRCALES